MLSQFEQVKGLLTNMDKIYFKIYKERFLDMSHKEIKRGEIYYFDFGLEKESVQSGRRPILVLQSDNFNENTPTVIVASITSIIKDNYLSSHIILGENFGLLRPSMVLLEQIQTVNKARLTDYVGFIDDEQIWKKINIALKKLLGLWLYNIELPGDIRCLCTSCLRGYLDNPNYVVRRLEPFARAKEKCDKCNRIGWDYVIYDRRIAFGEKGHSNGK